MFQEYYINRIAWEKRDDLTHVIEGRIGDRVSVDFISEKGVQEYIDFYSNKNGWTWSDLGNDEYLLERNSKARKSMRYHIYPKGRYLYSEIL